FSPPARARAAPGPHGMRPPRLPAALLLPSLLLFAPAPPAVADAELGATARSPPWQLDTPRPPAARPPTAGEGVLVAVLDTGVRGDHQDLRGSVMYGPDLTGAARTRGSWGDHGTAMASLIAGHGHGKHSGGGVLGVAPAARVLSVRVTLE